MAQYSPRLEPISFYTIQNITPEVAVSFHTKKNTKPIIAKTTLSKEFWEMN